MSVVSCEVVNHPDGAREQFYFDEKGRLIAFRMNHPRFESKGVVDRWDDDWNPVEMELRERIK